MEAQQTYSTQPGRAIARVDQSAIRGNVRRLTSLLTGGAELCAVVKADGYGHGLEQSAQAAVAGGATRLAVVTPTEAERVAALALGVPLIVLAPTAPSELERVMQAGAELTVCSVDEVLSAADAASKLGRSVDLHIKLDTGMGRFGARTNADALAAVVAAKEASSVSPVAVWTHFATADEIGDDYFPQQLARFSEFVDAARVEVPDLLAHAANSAALIREPSSHLDFARAGIAIYGLDPFGEDAAGQGLTPALSLHSYVASIREVAAGESVGYGRRWRAEADTTIATVPIGYGDGWRRILSNNCEVLIDRARHPQRGTVSMDSIMVELGVGSAVEIGSPVTLIGADGEQRITTEEVAKRAETINYEVTCGLTPRTIREYGGL